MTAADQVQTDPQSVAAPGRSRRRWALGGLLVRKERWGLSWRGWLAVGVLAIGGVVVALFWLHPFLAVTRPVQAEFLVVEGWVPTYALRQALDEFKSGGYRRLFTTGGPIADEERQAAYRTYAEWAAARLRNLGLAAESVESIASVFVVRNRTYASAVGLRRWFEEQGVSVKAINVVTLGAHARRTRLMYEKAFGKQVAIGIISVPNQSYDPQHWWESSEGVKEVILETVGYLYSRFFFWPPKASAGTPARSSAESGLAPDCSLGLGGDANDLAMGGCFGRSDWLLVA